MVVGINAYASFDPLPERDWYPAWFSDAKKRYFKGARSEALALAGALTNYSRWFSKLEVEWPRSFLGTNAIREYLRTEKGKWAALIREKDFDEHLSDWRRELDLLAGARVFPHLIVIFSQRFWPRAWQSFEKGAVAYSYMEVLEYEHTEGSAKHHVNRLRLRVNGQEQVSLLVRLGHPSRPPRRSAEWLCQQEGFRRLAGLCPE
jgi:hypothetical protein